MTRWTLVLLVLTAIAVFLAVASFLEWLYLRERELWLRSRELR